MVKSVEWMNGDCWKFALIFRCEATSWMFTDAQCASFRMEVHEKGSAHTWCSSFIQMHYYAQFDIINFSLPMNYLLDLFYSLAISKIFISVTYLDCQMQIEGTKSYSVLTEEATKNSHNLRLRSERYRKYALLHYFTLMRISIFDF